MVTALNYMLNGWDELLNYRNDGRYTIDNVNVLFPASGNQYKCLPLWQKTKVTKLCQ